MADRSPPFPGITENVKQYSWPHYHDVHSDVRLQAASDVSSAVSGCPFREQRFLHNLECKALPKLLLEDLQKRLSYPTSGLLPRY